MHSSVVFVMNDKIVSVQTTGITVEVCVLFARALTAAELIAGEQLQLTK